PQSGTVSAVEGWWKRRTRSRWRRGRTLTHVAVHAGPKARAAAFATGRRNPARLRRVACCREVKEERPARRAGIGGHERQQAMRRSTAMLPRALSLSREKNPKKPRGLRGLSFGTSPALRG